MASADETSRKLQLKEFQRNAQRLLTEDDRDYLHYVLKEYQTYKSVEKLVVALKSCLDTPKKLDLLADIRNLVPLAHLSRFDSIAPYHKMSHPFTPPDQVAPDRKTQSLKRDRVDSASIDSVGSFRVISLVKTSPEQSLGFSIRGGREHNTPLCISQVDENSPASKQNLLVGDQVIEVNGIDFEHIAHSSAVSLLASLNKVKMVVRSTVKVPSFRNESPRSNSSLSNGFTTWLSVKDGKPIPNGTIENGSLQSSGSTTHSIALQQHTHLLNGTDERRVNLMVEETPTGFIGFNIRGGAEYGLGIYVSRVDDGSLAEQAGFQVGDQILDVNGKSFETILHKNAVEYIRSQKHIVVTLKAVGRLPEARHYYSELSWVYPDGSSVKDSKKSEGSQSYSAPVSPVLPLELSHSSTQFPDHDDGPYLTPRAEIGCQTPEPSPENTMEVVKIEKSEAVEVQTVSPDLERSQSSKSIATSSTSSGGENEKRQSTYSIYSTDSVEGRDERVSSVGSRDDIILMASDAEGSRKGGDKKVKKSKSFLQKHGDKIKSKLSFRKKNKQRIDVRAACMANNYNEFSHLPRGPPVFEKGFGTQLMIGGTNKQQMIAYIEEKARKTLVVDEYNAVVRHMKIYQEQGDVELLVNNMLAILDKPEKALLLRDIRTLVSPYDLGRFDAMVSAREKEALDYLSMCVPGSPTIIPTAVEKPKRQLVAAIHDSKGSFQLRSEEEVEKIKMQKEELERKRTAVAWLGGSILSRDEGKRSQENLRALPDNYPMETIPTRDSGLSSLNVPVIQVSDDPSAAGSTHASIEERLEEQATPHVLLVPDRVSVEYKDEDEGESRNSQNGVASAASNGGIGLPVPSISVSSTPDKESSKSTEIQVTIMLPKKRTSLGISISGGKGSRTQPEIRVEKVFPGGAAADDGRLMHGDEIVSVDGSSLNGVTHAEAVDIIRRSYNNKTKEAMEIVVMKKA